MIDIVHLQKKRTSMSSESQWREPEYTSDVDIGVDKRLRLGEQRWQSPM